MRNLQGSKRSSRAPHLPDPETKSQLQQLHELSAKPTRTQKLLAPLRFQLGSPDIDKLALFEKEGFPIQLPKDERKQLDALIKQGAAAGKAPTTKLYIPGPFLRGAYRNVEEAAAGSH